MRNLAWIWFVGCGAWIIDAGISLIYRNWLHAWLALAIAALFFAAGLMFRKERN
jgi:NADH:ubiquinone oxidoreductase subunit 6 (subunit J)